MALRLKRSIFGTHIDLNIDTELPVEAIYSVIMWFKWPFKKHFDDKESKPFITNALYFLPGSCFVIFYFDEERQCFVQFMNVGGYLFLDFPFSSAGLFYDKEEELTKLFESQRFTRVSRKNFSASKKNTFITMKDNYDMKVLRASFRDDYLKAAELTLLIAKKIFNIKNPAVNFYESHKLIRANSIT